MHLEQISYISASSDNCWLEEFWVLKIILCGALQSQRTINSKVTKRMTNFTKGKRLAKAGRLTLTKAKAYIDLIKKKDELLLTTWRGRRF